GLGGPTICMTKNLAIVVPYRDRAEHMKYFIPHVGAFFSRAALEVGGRIKIKFIEQEAGLMFNRGLLKNIGYRLVRDDCDYICAHDVNHFPLWFDYSIPPAVAPLAWYGPDMVTDSRGFRIGHRDMTIHFGGAILFTNSAFEKINGYSNSYW